MTSINIGERGWEVTVGGLQRAPRLENLWRRTAAPSPGTGARALRRALPKIVAGGSPGAGVGQCLAPPLPPPSRRRPAAAACSADPPSHRSCAGGENAGDAFYRYKVGGMRCHLWMSWQWVACPLRACGFVRCLACF